MKETKFRLWCENRNEWEQDAWCINPDGVILCFFQGSMVPVKDETHIIEQYTVLKDKNNNEIYENDIIKILGRNRKVVFFKGSFIVENDIRNILVDRHYCCEITGNIHENPELLNH